MDIPQVLASLRPGVYWGPCAQTHSTYANLFAHWPESGSGACPTEAEMEAEWAALEAARPAALVAARRAAAIQQFLSSEEPVIVACRALFRMAFTRINDCDERDNLPRTLEEAIITEAMTGVYGGLGDAPAP